MRLLLYSLLISGCTFTGTNTGNPFRSPTSGTTSSNGDPFEIVKLVCARVAECYSTAEVDTCTQQTYMLSGYTSELGSKAAQYSTMADLSDAMVSKEMTANEEKATSCTSAIALVPCDDPMMTNAYSSATPGNYSATNRLFRASTECKLIYGSDL